MCNTDDEFIFTPEMVIDYYCKSQNILKSDIGIESIVIGCFLRDIWRLLISKTGSKQAKYWVGDTSRLYCGKYNGKNISIMFMPSGAPLAVATFEELIACGANKFIFTGIAGSLQKQISPGNLVIVDSAIRDEGTSLHYCDASEILKSDAPMSDIIYKKALAMKLNTHRGDTWTIDAPYREKKRRAEFLANKGVLTVEMEISALMSVARTRSVQLSAILLISDRLSDSLWFPGILGDDFKNGINNIVNLLMKSIMMI